MYQMPYQTLKGYQGNLYGEPEYSGLEYDPNVPDNNVVGSPGGVATTFHHYTKGFYGTGNSMSDIHAGLGYRYPYGEMGNMYQSGRGASQQRGYYPPAPDPNYSTPTQPAFASYPSRHSVGKDNTRTNLGPDIELIPPPDEEINVSQIEGFSSLSDLPQEKDPNRGVMTHKVVLPNPILLFLVFVVAYVAMDFWASSGQGLIQSYLNGGKKLTWQWFMFYAMIFTILMVFLTNLTGVPLITLEQL